MKNLTKKQNLGLYKFKLVCANLFLNIEIWPGHLKVQTDIELQLVSRKRNYFNKVLWNVYTKFIVAR